MPATITCGTCATKLKLPENSPTQTFQCPKCGSLIDATEAPREMSEAFRESAGNQFPQPESREPQRWEDEQPQPRRTAAPPSTSQQKDPTTAVLLEVLPGFLLQTFGIGHIYAGDVGVGLAFMFGYWVLLGLNAVLLCVGIGIFTGPACWLVFMILSPILAAQKCKKPGA